MDNILNILYLTDDNYAPFAGVSMTSLFINNAHIPEINVYVIDDNISEENKEKILVTAQKFNRKIIFMDLSSGIKALKDLGAPKYRNSYTTYLKLFAFKLLPDTVKRIFFIDSDSIVVGDLSEMITFDLQGNMIGAVRDGLTHSYKVALGYSETDSWFNMGVMLVDITKWKSENAEQKVIEQFKKRNAYIAVDQDLLNITQHNNISTLHPKYNATPHHYVYREEDFQKAMPQSGFYDVETLKDCRDNAVIRHFERFIGESPWHKHSIHPYKDLFDHFLTLSEWNGYVKKTANKSLTLKVEKVLYILLPKKIFLKIWATAFKKYLIDTNQHFAYTASVNNIN